MRQNEPEATVRPSGDSVAVIVVTWNGWQDALECLDSVFRSTYPNFHVIVCDNNSQRAHCLEKIEAWARGEQDWSPPDASPLGRTNLAPARRPETIERTSYVEDRARPVLHAGPLPDLLLVQTGSNLGYAGGNNVGIRYALEHSDVRFVWILNPDTVVEPDAMEAFVAYAARHPKAGLIGGVLLHYDDPNIVQAIGGGRWEPATGAAPRLCENEAYRPDYDYAKHTDEITWVHGACAFVSREMIEKIGLMSEIYFLYCEEMDWAERARGKLELGICRSSRVYHKRDTEQKSRFNFRRWYCVNRSKIIFTAKFYPRHLPAVLRIVAAAVYGRTMTVIRPYYVKPIKRLLTLVGVRR